MCDFVNIFCLPIKYFFFNYFLEYLFFLANSTPKLVHSTSAAFVLFSIHCSPENTEKQNPCFLGKSKQKKN